MRDSGSCTVSQPRGPGTPIDAGAEVVAGTTVDPQHLLLTATNTFECTETSCSAALGLSGAAFVGLLGAGGAAVLLAGLALVLVRRRLA